VKCHLKLYIDITIHYIKYLLRADVCTEKLSRRDAQLAGLLAYIHDTQSQRLHGYHGTDVDVILRLLRQPLPSSTADYEVSVAPGRAVVGPGTPHRWEHIEHDEHDLMHEIAHGLHFASIAMLGFLVLEVRGCLPSRK